ncbi:ABC transporter ATP-binding protein [Rhizobium sp. YTU87027]|uniref:ABC transporter ATP-binding protein n=1 Tax=Rhizobium sp. YTU87027 TaxID=3417741 RepID=UPI003D685CED
MPMALQCSNIAKRYAGQRGSGLGETGSGISFEVDTGELFALLGPSGCGKTTTLRIIGGFVEPDKGTIRIGGRDVTAMPPYMRPTNTVFQSYALFPHMRLGANVAFGLKMTGMAQEERLRHAAEALRLVGLEGLDARKVAELSGGQQQRAALARALANKPAVLLLDEPLGALDLKLRRQMQDELVALKQRTGTTFIHVTHDQEEACAIADRIAIMHQGRIAQIDTPRELYRTPRTTHVARFINLGTIVKGRAERNGSALRIAGPGLLIEGTRPAWLAPSAEIAAVLPRNRISVATRSLAAAAANQMEGTVERSFFTGIGYDLLVRSPDGLVIHVSATIDAFEGAEPGQPVVLSWRPEDVLFVEDDDDRPSAVQ